MLNQIPALIERAKEREENYKRIVVTELPDPYGLEEITLIGNYSYTGITTRTRTVKKKSLIELDENTSETPPAIARDYLRIKYNHGPTVKKIQLETLEAGIKPAPNYAKPARFDHGYYIDISAAYWSIMKIAGWNVDYYPGKWISTGTPPDDFPFPENKVARNCLVSAGYARPIQRFLPRLKTFDFIQPGNGLKNLGLYRLITDLLNSIAGNAIDLGAVYVNNDGYIAPNERTAAKIIGMIYDFGLTPAIKGEGEGSIKSAGAYKVGPLISKPWEIRTEKQFISAIHPPHYKDWLQRAFSFWAAEVK